MKELKLTTNKHTKPLTITLLILVITILVFIVPMPKTVAYYENEIVPITSQVEYSETVPHTETETYYEYEDYLGQDCINMDLDYELEWGTAKRECIDLTWNGCEEYVTVCELKIINKDEKDGTFVLDGYYRTSDNKAHFVKTITAYTQPGEEKELHWTYNHPTTNVLCSYKNLQIPTKVVCEPVIKSRRVTKTRDVIVYEEETKYRTETTYETKEVKKTKTEWETILQKIN